MLKDLKTLVKFISSGSLYRVVFNRPCVAGAVLQTPLFFTGAPLNFKVQIHLQSLALREIPSWITWDHVLKKNMGAPVNTVVFRR